MKKLTNWSAIQRRRPLPRPKVQAGPWRKPPWVSAGLTRRSPKVSGVASARRLKVSDPVSVVPHRV